MKHFESFLAPQLKQYVSYRQALGYAKKGIKPSLLVFDRYLIEQNATWHQLQPAFFLQLRAKISDHPNTVNTILSGRAGLNTRLGVAKGFGGIGDYLSMCHDCERHPFTPIKKCS